MRAFPGTPVTGAALRTSGRSSRPRWSACDSQPSEECCDIVATFALEPGVEWSLPRSEERFLHALKGNVELRIPGRSNRIVWVAKLREGVLRSPMLAVWRGRAARGSASPTDLRDGLGRGLPLWQPRRVSVVQMVFATSHQSQL
eukprot:CAMPEP_0179141978 /NCGR_PEP_ID=MMETSP0796-20121207/68152_1 /TAXON_ID=73915 /ORGANISM="Pyrodinium bahamense, Strain pbaha01" /LENGTH=143 /DNA_ID=CAMNT_0020841793 /DNA_START=34 /DNA_END=466 /DNA_ORIENTATION=+